MIIVAAKEIVVEAGLAGLSAREVARRVSYSPGTLYNVFKDRDEIILSVQSRLLDELDHYLEGLAATADPRQHVLSLADGYLAFTQANANLWNLLFEHRLGNGKAVPDWYQAKIHRLMKRIEEPLARLAPKRSHEEIERSARVLWAGVHGISSLSTGDKLSNVTAESGSDLVANLVTTYLDGVGEPTKPQRKAG